MSSPFLASIPGDWADHGLNRYMATVMQIHFIVDKAWRQR